jgi:hypothetical protein
MFVQILRLGHRYSQNDTVNIAVQVIEPDVYGNYHCTYMCSCPCLFQALSYKPFYELPSSTIDTQPNDTL